MDIQEIRVGKRLRPVNDEKVVELMQSIKDTVLQACIGVNGYDLVYGAHRLEACKRLGWKNIPAIQVGDINDPDSLKLAEIDENLFRSELSPTERAHHIKARVDIMTRRKLAKLEKEKVEAYKKKKNQQKTPELSTKVMADIKVAAEAAASAEAKKELAESLGVSDATVKRNIARHKLLEESDINSDEMSRLKPNQQKAVLKVMGEKGNDKAREEFEIQRNKAEGESVNSHAMARTVQEDFGNIRRSVTGIKVRILPNTNNTELQKCLEEALPLLERALELYREDKKSFLSDFES